MSSFGTKVIGKGLNLLSGGNFDKAQGQAEQASQIAAYNNNRLSSLIPTQGNTVSVGTNGPSFTYGGSNLGNGMVLQPGSNFGHNVGAPTAQGVVGPGIFRDPNTGAIFDGSTGEVIQGAQYVAPGQSNLNLNIPNFTPNLGGLQASSERLLGLNGELAGLGQQFQDAGNLTSEQLLAISNQAGELLPQVALGASEVRDARREAIESGRLRTVSDLKNSMARRRIAGSSFATDRLGSVNAEFDFQRGQGDAQSSLEEIATTAQILGFQSQVISASGNVLMAGLNGDLSAFAQQAANERQVSGNELGGAQLSLQAQQAQFASEVQALSLAFGGQKQAQEYLQNLLALANGSTDIAASTKTNEASLSAGIGNAGIAAVAEVAAAYAGKG